MLQYNFKRIFKARGIDHPIPFLRAHGFSDNFSIKIKNNLVKRMNPGDLERVCVILNCTPNDLMEWIPDKDSDAGAEHQLNQIKKTDKVIEISRTLNSVPLQYLDIIEEMVGNAVKELTGKEKEKENAKDGEVKTEGE